jgi:hypothetical protein
MNSPHLLDDRDKSMTCFDIILAMVRLLDDKVNENSRAKHAQQIIVMFDECLMTGERALTFDDRTGRAGETLVISSLTLTIRCTLLKSFL